MPGNICPRCKTEPQNGLLYQCVRCFTTYCTSCPDTEQGHKCPKCGFTGRMLITPPKEK